MSSTIYYVDIAIDSFQAPTTVAFMNYLVKRRRWIRAVKSKEIHKTRNQSRVLYAELQVIIHHRVVYHAI